MPFAFELSAIFLLECLIYVEQTFFPNPYTQRGAATKIGISNDGETIAYGSGTNVIIRSVKVGCAIISVILESHARLCLLRSQKACNISCTHLSQKIRVS